MLVRALVRPSRPTATPPLTSVLSHFGSSHVASGSGSPRVVLLANGPLIALGMCLWFADGVRGAAGLCRPDLSGDEQLSDLRHNAGDILDRVADDVQCRARHNICVRNGATAADRLDSPGRD